MRTWIAGRSSMTGIEGVVSGLLQLNRMVTYIIARRPADRRRSADDYRRRRDHYKWLRDKGGGYGLKRISDIRKCAASEMLSGALDAFARLDSEAAAEILREDAGVDERFKAILRQLITFMMGDPKTISSAIDTIWAAKNASSSARRWLPSYAVALRARRLAYPPPHRSISCRDATCSLAREE